MATPNAVDTWKEPSSRCKCGSLKPWCCDVNGSWKSAEILSGKQFNKLLDVVTVDF